jgi:hypothetical protein
MTDTDAGKAEAITAFVDDLEQKAQEATAQAKELQAQAKEARAALKAADQTKAEELYADLEKEKFTSREYWMGEPNNCTAKEADAQIDRYRADYSSRVVHGSAHVVEDISVPSEPDPVAVEHAAQNPRPDSPEEAEYMRKRQEQQAENYRLNQQTAMEGNNG